MIVFRADTRGPAEIGTSGFKARNPMSLAAAKAHLLSYCTSGKKPLDLSRRIISSPQPEYVSTDPTQGCGGYSGKGYVYRIEIINLAERPWTNQVLGQNLNLKPNMLWPKLVPGRKHTGRGEYHSPEAFRDRDPRSHVPDEYPRLQHKGVPKE